MTNILLLGGTGKTGRRLARRLRSAGHPVRIASRAQGDVVVDLDDPDTWPAALDGVTAAYVVEPALQTSEAGRQRIPRFITAAVAAGVRRLVLLSAPAAGREDHPLHAAEQAVRNAGVEWTVLRPDWFAQNFTEGAWLRGILSGELALPTGAGRTPFIDAEDIAEVAAAALTGSGHHAETYDLTGPRAIGFGEATALISQAVGRTVRHADIDPAEFIERQVAVGVPRPTVQLLTEVMGVLRDGGTVARGDGTIRALGRPPRRFEDFVTEAAASGVWNTEVPQRDSTSA